MRRRDFIRGLALLGVSAAVADKLAFVQGFGRTFPGAGLPAHPWLTPWQREEWGVTYDAIGPTTTVGFKNDGVVWFGAMPLSEWARRAPAHDADIWSLRA